MSNGNDKVSINKVNIGYISCDDCIPNFNDALGQILEQNKIVAFKGGKSESLSINTCKTREAKEAVEEFAYELDIPCISINLENGDLYTLLYEAYAQLLLDCEMDLELAQRAIIIIENVDYVPNTKDRMATLSALYGLVSGETININVNGKNYAFNSRFNTTVLINNKLKQGLDDLHALEPIYDRTLILDPTNFGSTQQHI